MPIPTSDYDRRKSRALQRLNATEPICGACGERDWRALEAHHPADFGRDDATVIICRNCHRKVSDDQRDHPPFDPAVDPMLDRIGHFLLGLADLLRIIVEKLIEFANLLIVQSADTVEGHPK